MRLLTFLLLAGAATASAVDRPDFCATPVAIYRNYHEVSAAKDPQDHLIRVFDEGAFCFTATGKLAFQLQVIGDKGKECLVQGEAKPRREDVFVFVGRGLRLRFKVDRRKIDVDFDSETYDVEGFPALCSAIEELKLRHHSGELRDNSRLHQTR